MPLGIDTAVKAGTQLVGGIVGALDIGGDRRRRKQVEQQQKLTDMQTEANRGMATFNQGLAKEMFDYTARYNSPEEEMKRLKDAGLNPALMYGGSGAGATGTTSGAGAGGGAGMATASDEASMKNAQTNAIQQGLGIAMQQAQIKLMEAQATKTETEAKNIGEEGIDTKQKEATIENMVANTKTEGERFRLQRVQADLGEISKTIASQTTTEAMDNIRYQAESIKAQVRSANANAKVDEATANNRIAIVEQELVNMAVEKIFAEAKISQTKAERDAIGVKLMQGWQTIDVGKEGNKIRDFEARLKQDYPGLMNLSGKALQDFVYTLNETISGQNQKIKK